MLNEVEISSIDLRYESYRLKNPARENFLPVLPDAVNLKRQCCETWK